MKIKRGDTVKVRSGKDRGKTGIIEKVIKQTNMVIIKDINMVKKHQKPTSSLPKGGIIEKPLPMPASKVGFICSHCHKVTRIGYKMTDAGKVRICQKCKEILS